MNLALQDHAIEYTCGLVERHGYRARAGVDPRSPIRARLATYPANPLVGELMGRRFWRETVQNGREVGSAA